jgi:hypothetical protein
VRRAVLLSFALTSCSVLRNLDDLAGDAGTDAATDGGVGGGSCEFSASGGSSAGGSHDGDQVAGCSDGTRELFIDPGVHPDIAGCSGGFSVAGVLSAAARAPQCGRHAGNHGLEPSGWGCSVADLCSLGWHVCESAAEVALKSANGECANDGLGFWATRQSQDDQRLCIAAGNNNLVGCGVGLGEAPHPSCDPLALELRETHCNGSCAWICDGTSVFDEADFVQKYGPEDGGVLCCRD